MVKANSTNALKAVPAHRFKDQTDALLKEWLSLPPDERSRKFVDTARAAQMAGVRRRTIQVWIDAGEVRALCIGRKLHVDLDSLCQRIQSEARFWAAGEVRPTRQARKRNSRIRSI